MRVKFALEELRLVAHNMLVHWKHLAITFNPEVPFRIEVGEPARNKACSGKIIGRW